MHLGVITDGRYDVDLLRAQCSFAVYSVPAGHRDYATLSTSGQLIHIGLKKDVGFVTRHVSSSVAEILAVQTALLWLGGSMLLNRDTTITLYSDSLSTLSILRGESKASNMYMKVMVTDFLNTTKVFRHRYKFDVFTQIEFVFVPGSLIKKSVIMH